MAKEQLKTQTPDYQKMPINPPSGPSNGGQPSEPGIAPSPPGTAPLPQDTGGIDEAACPQRGARGTAGTSGKSVIAGSVARMSKGTAPFSPTADTKPGENRDSRPISAELARSARLHSARADGRAAARHPLRRAGDAAHEELSRQRRRSSPRRWKTITILATTPGWAAGKTTCGGATTSFVSAAACTSGRCSERAEERAKRE